MTHTLFLLLLCCCTSLERNTGKPSTHSPHLGDRVEEEDDDDEVVAAGTDEDWTLLLISVDEEEEESQRATVGTATSAPIEVVNTTPTNGRPTHHRKVEEAVKRKVEDI